MLHLVATTSQTIVRLENASPIERANWLRKFWQKFVDWPLEPIPLPGKCDINVPLPRSYNEGETPTSPPIES